VKPPRADFTLPTVGRLGDEDALSANETVALLDSTATTFQQQ